MAYITYAPIDRQFRTLEGDLPPGAPFNQVDPMDGITFGFSLSSRYPLAVGAPDVRFGTIAKVPADNPAILLRVITKAEYDAAYAVEMAARDAQPEPAPTLFADLSDRQFFQALATAPYSLITQAEALDAVKTGEIPAVMQAVIDALPEDQVFPTAMILSGATSFQRSSPLVGIFAASQGMDTAAVDAFWRFAETL